jgi:hypothetical protein
MALSGAVLEAVTGCWLSGCWATFIRAFLPLEPAHLTPVYGRLPVFIAGSLPGNTPTLFTQLSKKKGKCNEKETAASWSMTLAVVQRLRHFDPFLGTSD